MHQRSDKPVFFDSSGKRWARFKVAAFGIAVIVSTTLAIAIPKVARPSAVPAFGYNQTPTTAIQTEAVRRAAALAAPQRPAFQGKSSDPDNLNVQTLLSSMQTVIPKPSPAPVAHPVHLRTPAEIAYSIKRKTMPIVGDGPLIRVSAVSRTAQGVNLYDPYTGRTTKNLTQLESQQVGAQPYVIEKYGVTKGKRIALTFDDGPDALYTPQLLDLLSREKAPSTFFIIGQAVVKYPDIINRIVREGHILGNHTFTHIDFDYTSPLESRQEIIQTNRMARAVNGYTSGYFRLPYGGNDDNSLRDNARGILEAQQLGYTVTLYDFDADDWAFPYGLTPKMPAFDGSDHVILLHDAGGDRTKTLQYVQELIKAAKANGYSFVNLDGMFQDVSQPLFQKITATPTDYASLVMANIAYTWPNHLMNTIFIFTVFSIFITAFVNVVLAAIQTLRMYIIRRRQRYQRFSPLVTVLIPAYNEERVVAKTVSSVLQSYYKKLEVILIDDGSTDSTWEVMQKIARRSRRVRILHQVNSGKSAALNYGISAATGDIIIAMDADTIFTPKTIGKLTRHFADPTIGGVAGIVKVGNVRNPLTRWQALEYITGINIQRTAQALMNAITIVPGACGAWRADALRAAGGYSTETLAEDCDLTLMVRKAGYKIVQDVEALSFTESPESLRALAKQRFRWTFGNLQAYYKHRDMLLRPKYRWLGMFVLPNTIISIILPLAFVPILMSVTIENMIGGQFVTLGFYYIVTLLIQFIISLIGVLLANEKLSHLLAVPITRLLYGPLRSYLIFRSALTVLQGANVGWNKLARTGNVHYGGPLITQTQTIAEP